MARALGAGGRAGSAALLQPLSLPALPGAAGQPGPHAWVWCCSRTGEAPSYPQPGVLQWSWCWKGACRGRTRGWFPSAAEQKAPPLLPVVLRGGFDCAREHLQPRTHLKDTPLTSQGPKTQLFRGKTHFWKRTRELELGETKAPGLCRGWTSGAAFSSAAAAKWHEKKL